MRPGWVETAPFTSSRLPHTDSASFSMVVSFLLFLRAFFSFGASSRLTGGLSVPQRLLYPLCALIHSLNNEQVNSLDILPFSLIRSSFLLSLLEIFGLGLFHYSPFFRYLPPTFIWHLPQNSPFHNTLSPLYNSLDIACNRHTEDRKRIYVLDRRLDNPNSVVQSLIQAIS